MNIHGSLVVQAVLLTAGSFVLAKVYPSVINMGFLSFNIVKIDSGTF